MQDKETFLQEVGQRIIDRRKKTWHNTRSSCRNK